MHIPGRGKISRAEKKARKAIAKQGMKQLPGIDRVTIRKAKNIQFTINNPDVFKSPASDTYVIFGEAKIEDYSASQQAMFADQFRALQQQMAAADRSGAAGASASAAAPALAAAEDEEEGDVDETGLEPKDIELVMTQAGVTRGKAVRALKKADGVSPLPEVDVPLFFFAFLLHRMAEQSHCLASFAPILQDIVSSIMSLTM